MHEKEITQQAITQLHSQTGLRMSPSDVSEVLGTGLWADMLIKLEHTNIELITGVRQLNKETDPSPIIKQLRLAAGARAILIIANHIDTKQAEQFRQADINYLDTAGNAYLNAPPLYVLIQGNKMVDTDQDIRANKIFNTAQLQVIFALLSNPQLLNANYGEIATHSNVALGVVGTIVRELKDQGYFAESGSPRKREWRERHKLIASWVAQYPKLRDKHFIGSFVSDDNNWWKSDVLSDHNALLGGDFAALCYSKYVKPTHASVYVDDQQQWDFLREMRFTKNASAALDPNSGIQVYAKFWGSCERTEAIRDVTHPLITYADVIHADNPNNHAAANEIAQRYFSH